MSNTSQSLSHSRWHCQYHVVCVPKRRRKALFGHLRKALGPIFHALARLKECRILEGHVMPDHGHLVEHFVNSLQAVSAYFNVKI
jgi:putative transposase